VRPGSIVGAMTGESSLSGSDIGKIDIFPSFALVEVTSPIDNRSMEKLGRAVIGGRRLNLREDTGPKSGPRRGGEGRFAKESFGDRRPGKGFRDKARGERGGEKSFSGRPRREGEWTERRASAPSRPRQPRY
jgi:ATP-dependent RNA helicase DeaD